MPLPGFIASDVGWVCTTAWVLRCYPGCRRRLGADDTTSKKGRSNRIPVMSMGKGRAAVPRLRDDDDDSADG